MRDEPEALIGDSQEIRACAVPGGVTAEAPSVWPDRVRRVTAGGGQAARVKRVTPTSEFIIVTVSIVVVVKVAEVPLMIVVKVLLVGVELRGAVVEAIDAAVVVLISLWRWGAVCLAAVAVDQVPIIAELAELAHAVPADLDDTSSVTAVAAPDIAVIALLVRVDDSIAAGGDALDLAVRIAAVAVDVVPVVTGLVGVELPISTDLKDGVEAVRIAAISVDVVPIITLLAELKVEEAIPTFGRGRRALAMCLAAIAVDEVPVVAGFAGGEVQVSVAADWAGTVTVTVQAVDAELADVDEIAVAIFPISSR